MLADRRYCYPLTITDFASRYLLCCDSLETTREMYAFGVFERAFKEFGMPLSPYPQDRFQYRVRRTERRHQRGEREDLAGDLCTTTWVSSITKKGA